MWSVREHVIDKQTNLLAKRPQLPAASTGDELAPHKLLRFLEYGRKEKV